MFNCLEFSGGNFRFLSQILYTYNVDNPIQDHKVNHKHQINLERIVRARKSQNPLPKDAVYPHQKAK